MIKIGYKSFGSFELSQAIAKIDHAQTTSQKAGQIHQLVKRIKAGREKIHNEYEKEIIKPFGEVDKKTGKVPPNQNLPGGFEMKEGVMEDFQKAFDTFEKRHVEIDWRPFNPEMLSDVKLSAHEIDLLGDLYTPNAGPGVPEMTQGPQIVRGPKAAKEDTLDA
jgi:hypothetical protein